MSKDDLESDVIVECRKVARLVAECWIMKTSEHHFGGKVAFYTCLILLLGWHNIYMQDGFVEDSSLTKRRKRQNSIEILEGDEENAPSLVLTRVQLLMLVRNSCLAVFTANVGAPSLFCIRLSTQALILSRRASNRVVLGLARKWLTLKLYVKMNKGGERIWLTLSQISFIEKVGTLDLFKEAINGIADYHSASNEYRLKYQRWYSWSECCVPDDVRKEEALYVAQINLFFLLEWPVSAAY